MLCFYHNYHTATADFWTDLSTAGDTNIHKMAAIFTAFTFAINIVYSMCILSNIESRKCCLNLISMDASMY